MPRPSTSRLAWIDWMRGLACVLMFQTHCYDSWLGGEARNSNILMYSQLGGTLPAPLFLFLAGISFALVTDKLIRKNRDVLLSGAGTERSGVPAESKDPYLHSRTQERHAPSESTRPLTPSEITRTMARRGAEVFAFGLLFRLQEYLIAWGWAPWSDLLRVDVLNMIGLSMILMALACGVALRLANPLKPRVALIAVAVSGAGLIALLAPLLWTTWRPTWLPWPLESYINGVHNLRAPQPWLFPIFPWTAFAFAGLAAGFVLFSDWGRAHTAQTIALFGLAGGAFILSSRWFDHLPVQLYSVYDYWHTSPNFFLLRVGILLAIALISYAWCRWGLGGRGFSPLIQLGQTSLLVYWVHIEFVYGRFSLLPKRANGIWSASLGLLTIFLMMLALSMLRTRIDWKTVASSLRHRIFGRTPLRHSDTAR